MHKCEGVLLFEGIWSSLGRLIQREAITCCCIPAGQLPSQIHHLPASFVDAASCFYSYRWLEKLNQLDTTMAQKSSFPPTRVCQHSPLQSISCFSGDGWLLPASMGCWSQASGRLIESHGIVASFNSFIFQATSKKTSPFISSSVKLLDFEWGFFPTLSILSLCWWADTTHCLLNQRPAETICDPGLIPLLPGMISNSTGGWMASKWKKTPNPYF